MSSRQYDHIDAGEATRAVQSAIHQGIGFMAYGALAGMRNERELKENVATADRRLSADDCAGIERIFAEVDIPSYRDVELVT